MLDTANFNVDTSAFTVRNPRIKPWQLILIGLFIALTLYFSAHADSLTTRNLVSVTVSALIVAFLYLIQKFIYDEKTATEYQCLIFSGAMRSNTLLSLILNRDGSIYYLDARYAMNFPLAKASHNFEQFIATIGVSDADRAAIYDVINTAKPLELVYKNNDQPLKIAIYPISRPAGFFSFSLIAS